MEAAVWIIESLDQEEAVVLLFGWEEQKWFPQEQVVEAVGTLRVKAEQGRSKGLQVQVRVRQATVRQQVGRRQVAELRVRPPLEQGQMASNFKEAIAVRMEQEEAEDFTEEVQEVRLEMASVEAAEDRPSLIISLSHRRRNGSGI